MLINTLLIRCEGESAVPIQVSDLVVEPEFPKFQEIASELPRERETRWQHQRKALQGRQVQFILTHLCRIFVAVASVEQDYVSAGEQDYVALHQKMSNEILKFFNDHSLVRVLQYGNVICDETINTQEMCIQGVCMVKVEFMFLTSFVPRIYYIRNQK